MGPTAVFDKSFLQMLTEDESVWFDQFFVPIITPLFFVETLADLQKENVRAERTPEDEVRILAKKTPEMHSVPHTHSSNICRSELLGIMDVPMEGRPILPHGRQVEVDGKKGVVFEVAPEADALRRWQSGEFREVERRFAKAWREALRGGKIRSGEGFLVEYADEVRGCSSMPQVRELVRSIVSDTKRKPADRMGFVFDTLSLDSVACMKAYRRFTEAGFPSLTRFAPYTAHVTEVELFFRFAMDRGFVAKERASNWVDIAYLNYLPTCHTFISNDRLHKASVPLFLKNYQRFADGAAVKADLARLDAKFKSLPESERRKPINEFASRPPTDEPSIITDLWDAALRPIWRSPPKPSVTNETSKELLKSLKKFSTSATPAEQNFDSDSADALILKRRVHKRRGSWQQLPPELSEGGLEVVE